jgi:DNA repair protein RecN (Recombination protein N)
MVEKKVSADTTATASQPIRGDRRVAEIARMLAGDQGNSASLEHARTLLTKYGG